MGPGFLETMRGSLMACSVSPGGVEDARADAREHLVDFTIKTEAKSLRRFLKDGRSRADGVMHAAPWAVAAPCTGELTISLRPARIAYALSFRADDGRVLSLSGRKTPSLLDPIGGMTRLPMTLVDEQGVTLARGTVFFALGELPAFLSSWLSWLPASRTARAALDVERVSLRRRALEA